MLDKKSWNEHDNYNNITYVQEVFVDGNVKSGLIISEYVGSYGILMHSLALSSKVREEFSNENDRFKDVVSEYTRLNGFDSEFISSTAPKINTIEIDEDIKTSAHLINRRVRLLSTGSAIKLIKRCSYIILNSKLVKMTRKIARETWFAFEEMIKKGLKVYAIAIKDLNTESKLMISDDNNKKSSIIDLDSEVHIDYALLALVGF